MFNFILMFYLFIFKKKVHSVLKQSYFNFINFNMCLKGWAKSIYFDTDKKHICF